MGFEYHYEENQSCSDQNYDEDVENLEHKRQVRKIIEERLERKRLKEEFQDELEDFDEDFDWDDIEK